MKKIMILIPLISSLLLATNTDNEQKIRTEKQIKKEIEKEKKYSREGAFYQQKNYDFKRAKVNQETLDSIPDIEVQDDFDMDSVYD